MSHPLDGKLAVRPTQLADMTDLDDSTIRNLVRAGVIPRLPNTGKAIVIPAWAVRAWEATGDWNHPDYQPNATAPAAATAGA